jgi:hypothetical protein
VSGAAHYSNSILFQFDGSTRLLYDYYEVKLRQMKVAIDAAQKGIRATRSIIFYFLKKTVPQQPVNEQQPVDIADLILRYQELQADMEELQRIRQLMYDRDYQLRDVIKYILYILSILFSEF